MHIGLIGGIGPAATDFYYRRLIKSFAERRVPLDLTIVHADTPTLLGNLAINAAAAQVEIYQRLTLRLADAGAQCVAVTSIAGHFCIEAFKATSPLPVVDLVAVVNRAIVERRLARIGILGTRTVMETRLYGSVTGAAIVTPSGQDLDDVHEAYVAMAASGVVTDAQLAIFRTVGQGLIDHHGAEAIMLGGTDLALAFREGDSPFPLVDCAGIHADAIVEMAIR